MCRGVGGLANYGERLSSDQIERERGQDLVGGVPHLKAQVREASLTIGRR